MITMLVLSRNPKEAILIHTSDGIIEVSINQVKGAQVRFGIDAPDDILVMRKEIDESHTNGANESAF
jgi:carbon storage regulator